MTSLQWQLYKLKAVYLGFMICFQIIKLYKLFPFSLITMLYMVHTKEPWYHLLNASFVLSFVKILLEKNLLIRLTHEVLVAHTYMDQCPTITEFSGALLLDGARPWAGTILNIPHTIVLRGSFGY